MSPEIAQKSSVHSITAKLILSVLLFYIVLAFIFLPWQMLSAYHEQQDDLIFELQRLQTILRAGLTDAAWRHEDEEIDVLLKSVLSTTSVLGVYMERYIPEKTQWREGYTLEEVSHLDYRVASSRRVTSGLWPILLSKYTKPVVHQFELVHEEAPNKGQVIGKVQFYSNTAVVIEAVRLEFIDIILRAIMRITLLSLFLLWIGYRFLSKPLKVLMQATDAISRGELDSVREKLRDHKLSFFQTEVDELVTAFQKMAAQVETARTEADNARAHLTEIFQNITLGVNRH